MLKKCSIERDGGGKGTGFQGGLGRLLGVFLRISFG